MQCHEHWQLPNVANKLNFSLSSRIHLEMEQQHCIFSACSAFVYSHAGRRVAKIFERYDRGIQNKTQDASYRRNWITPINCSLQNADVTSPFQKLHLYEPDWSGPHIQSTVNHDPPLLICQVAHCGHGTSPKRIWISFIFIQYTQQVTHSKLIFLTSY
jgi:hypothetical protein